MRTSGGSIFPTAARSPLLFMRGTVFPQCRGVQDLRLADAPLYNWEKFPTFCSYSLGENEPMSRRISSIEGFRVLAILGVILWHTDLLLRLRQLGGGRWPVDVTIDMVWWVSLPYFFIVAGYFYGKSVEAEGEPIRHLGRYASSLFGILVAWVCVYTVVPDNWLVAVRD